VSRRNASAAKAARRAAKAPRQSGNPPSLSEKESRVAALAERLRRDPPFISEFMQTAPKYVPLAAVWMSGEYWTPEEHDRAVVEREDQIEGFRHRHRKPVAPCRGCGGGLAA
jgi:hypothetical protein